MRQPFDTLLDELRQGAQMPDQGTLYLLSNLDVDETAQLRQAWPQLPVELRRKLVTKLAEVAEADFEVNFGVVFRLGMEDEDADVRANAIEGLWEDEDVRLVPSLITCMRDEDVGVRAAAATSLGRFILLGELGKIRPAPYEQAYEALLTVCQNVKESLEVRRRAMESLSYVSNEIVTGLIDAAYAAPEEKARVSAVFSMGRSADTRWARQVQEGLSSPNPELRYEAARACGELQLSEAVLALEELVEDADPEVQEAALWALGQIGGDRAREILEQYCQSDYEATRAAAEAAMDELEFLYGDLDDFFDRLAREQED